MNVWLRCLLCYRRKRSPDVHGKPTCFDHFIGVDCSLLVKHLVIEDMHNFWLHRFTNLFELGTEWCVSSTTYFDQMWILILLFILNVEKEFKKKVIAVTIVISVPEVEQTRSFNI